MMIIITINNIHQGGIAIGGLQKTAKKMQKVCYREYTHFYWKGT